MTPGEIALIALARLDELTFGAKDWDKLKFKRRIRYIINIANNDIEKAKMGITYQAHVEVFFAASAAARSVDQWQEISRWELQKDYGFSIAWSAVAQEGWPNDHAPIIGRDVSDSGDAYQYYEGRRWADGEYFRVLNYEDEFDWFCELRSHVLSLLGRGYKVRVLTWDE